MSIYDTRCQGPAPILRQGPEDRDSRQTHEGCKWSHDNLGDWAIFLNIRRWRASSRRLAEMILHQELSLQPDTVCDRRREDRDRLSSQLPRGNLPSPWTTPSPPRPKGARAHSGALYIRGKSLFPSLGDTRGEVYNESFQGEPGISRWYRFIGVLSRTAAPRRQHRYFISLFTIKDSFALPHVLTFLPICWNPAKGMFSILLRLWLAMGIGPHCEVVRNIQAALQGKTVPETKNELFKRGR